jgi:hypothetical protein
MMTKQGLAKTSIVLSMLLLSMLVVPAAKAQLVLNKSNDMSFGTLEFDASHSGTIQLGTNGAITVVGASGIAHNGSGTAGRVTITGTPLDVVELKCTNSGKLTASGGPGIDLTNVEIAIDNGAAFGSALACQGTKKNSPVVTTIDLATNNSPVVLMGGALSLPNNGLSSETYDTLGNGKAITLTVVFQ